MNVLAIINIVAFAFLFMKIPFTEFEENIIYNENVNIAYYLHLLSFIFIAYFWYLFYDSNKKEKVFSVLNNKKILWIAIAVLVIILSAEVVLQGLHLMDFSIDQNQLEILYGDKYEMLSSAKYKIIKTGLPVLWGLLSFLLLLWGIKKQLKQLRIIALTLLGLTIVKLFVYDISNVSEIGKIIAFILLAILILIISFVYQKIKVLVIDENKTPKNDEIN